MKKALVLLLTLVLALALAACGNDGGNDSGQIKIDGELYQADHWQPYPDYDSDTTVGYALVFLSTTDTLPISFQMGTNTPEVMLVPELTVDGGTLLPQQVEAAYDKDADSKFIATISYAFELPKGAELPTSGVLHDKIGEQDFDLDLSALPVVEADAEAETDAEADADAEADTAAPDADAAE